MQRNAIGKLIEWKNDEERKSMILRGARQVGKTWIMKEFGKNHFSNFVYFNRHKRKMLFQIRFFGVEAAFFIEPMS